MRGRFGTVLVPLVLVAASSVTTAARGDTPPPTLKPGMPAPNGAPFPKPGPDVDSTAPISTTQPPPSAGPSPGGPQPKTATPFAYQHVCGFALDPVVATPADLVTGNCENGWHIDTTEYDYVQNIPWIGGKMHGDYDGCGWIDQDYMQYNGAQQYDGCDTPSRDRSDYIYDGGSGPWIWTGSTDDGLPFDNPYACPEYANYRPWSMTSQPVDYLNTVPAHATDASGNPRLRIRYLAKYTSADGSGYYVMARDTSGISGWTPSWVFIPYNCL